MTNTRPEPSKSADMIFSRFDPIPTETLLNLGFDGGESMAQDWFELCENPDPVVDKQAVSPAVTTTSLGEDEEEVWRRLVSKCSLFDAVGHIIARY